MVKCFLINLIYGSDVCVSIWFGDLIHYQLHFLLSFWSIELLLLLLLFDCPFFFLDKMWFDWLILQSIHFFFLAIKWHYHLIDGIFFLFLFWSMWIEYMWFIFHHLMEWTFLILIDLIKSLYFIFIKSVLIPLIDHIFFTSCFFFVVTPLLGILHHSSYIWIEMLKLSFSFR